MKIDWSKIALAGGAVALFVWLAKAAKSKDGLNGLGKEYRIVRGENDLVSTHSTKSAALKEAKRFAKKMGESLYVYWREDGKTRGILVKG